MRSYVRLQRRSKRAGSPTPIYSPAARFRQDLGGENSGPLHRVRERSDGDARQHLCQLHRACSRARRSTSSRSTPHQPRHRRDPRAARSGEVSAVGDALESLHHRRSAHAHQRGCERVSQDARRAAAACRVHPRHDRRRNQLPPTILSRCQRYAFRRIPVETMIGRMREIADAERDRDRRRGARRDRIPRRRRFARRVDDARTSRRVRRRTRRRGDRRCGVRRDRAGVRARPARCKRWAATPPRRCARSTRPATRAATCPVLIRALIAEFRHLLVARVDPELLARDLAADDAAGRRSARQRRCRRRVLVRALRLFGRCARRRAQLAATRGSNSRPRCCASSCRPKTRRSTRSPRGSPPWRTARRSPQPPRRLSRPAPAAPAPLPAPLPAPAAAEPGPEAPPKASRGGAALSLQKVRAAWQTIRGKVEGERPPLRAPAFARDDRIAGEQRDRFEMPDTWSAGALRDYAPLIEKAVADVFGRRTQGRAARRRRAPRRAKGAIARRRTSGAGKRRR